MRRRCCRSAVRAHRTQVIIGDGDVSEDVIIKARTPAAAQRHSALIHALPPPASHRCAFMPCARFGALRFQQLNRTHARAAACMA